MLTQSLGLLLTLISLADEPKSGALLQALPTDGAWVTFSVNVKINGQDFTPTWTARSVGKAFHEGKPCRFIEVEQAVDAPTPEDIPQLGNMVWRFLIPEEEFGEGKDPLSKSVKIWAKIGKADSEAVESIAIRDPILAILLQGPKQNLRAEDNTEKVSWQQGDLECSVVAGQNESEFGGLKLSITHRVFRHRDVPFGIAGMRQELKVTIGAQEQTAVIRMSLRDHGKDAKPKLPELVP